MSDFLSFGLRGPSPQAFTSFGRVGFIARRLRRPKKGNADGAEGIFGNCRMRVGYGPAPGPTVKRPCAILARLVGQAINTARLIFKWVRGNLFAQKYCNCLHIKVFVLEYFENIQLFSINRFPALTEIIINIAIPYRKFYLHTVKWFQASLYKTNNSI